MGVLPSPALRNLYIDLRIIRQEISQEISLRDQHHPRALDAVGLLIAPLSLRIPSSILWYRLARTGIHRRSQPI